MPDLQIRRLHGAEIRPFLDAVARLRIAVFREFPYLYEGSLDYEARYLETYSTHPESVFVLAFDGDEVVGASTGLPAAGADDAFRAPLEEHGHDPAQVFYFGESVLRTGYRGHGVGHRFFDEREDYAAALRRFRYTAFCAVERPEDHPLRPRDYRSLHAFWKSRGYVRHPEMRALYRWQDVDEPEETEKPLVFWMKALPAEPANTSNGRTER